MKVWGSSADDTTSEMCTNLNIIVYAYTYLTSVNAIKLHILINTSLYGEELTQYRYYILHWFWSFEQYFPQNYLWRVTTTLKDFPV